MKLVKHEKQNGNQKQNWINLIQMNEDDDDHDDGMKKEMTKNHIIIIMSEKEMSLDDN